MNMSFSEHTQGKPTYFKEMVCNSLIKEGFLNEEQLEVFVRMKKENWNFDAIGDRTKDHTIRKLNFTKGRLRPFSKLRVGRWYWFLNEHILQRPLLAKVINKYEDKVEVQTQARDKLFQVTKLEIDAGPANVYLARYYPGIIIKPFVWNEKPYTSPQVQFAPIFPIKRVYFFHLEYKNNKQLYDYSFGKKRVSYNDCGVTGQSEAIENIAIHDGFNNSVELTQWFENGIYGQIIVWGNDDHLINFLD